MFVPALDPGILLGALLALPVAAAGSDAVAYQINTSHSGVLTAFATATGHELWSVQMPGQSSFTAYDGVVYVSGAGVGGTV